MSIQCVSKPALTVVGILVEAQRDELAQAIRTAWHELFAREVELTPSCGPLGERLEAGISCEGDLCTELIGVVVEAGAPVPRGMVRLDVPANRYLRLIHDGPLPGIADGFRALYDRAAAEGIETTGFRLDLGYRPGLPPGRHELLVGLAPLAEPRAA